MSGREIDDAIRKLIEQWNIAERRIKKAEQVRANEVVAEAIFELRYAARKHIDASEIILGYSPDVLPDNEKQKVLEYLADATEDCVKAKHDAIDAMMDFITSWFDRTENKLGLSAVTKFFPNYIEVSAKISDIQDRIAASRADRTKLRDAIYNQIEKDGYDEILALFSTMRLSEARVEAEVQAEFRQKEAFVQQQIDTARRQRIALAISASGAVSGLIGLILTIASLFRH